MDYWTGTLRDPGWCLAIILALARKILPRPIPASDDLRRVPQKSPFLVQLFYIYFGLGSLGYAPPPVFGAVLALTLNLSAYSTENHSRKSGSSTRVR